MKRFDESLYVAHMYRDSYYPDFLVDKVRAQLVGVVAVLEGGERDISVIQKKFDEAMIGINDLEDEFDANDSEIETVARESIGQTVIDILAHFDIDLDLETAMRERDW